MLVAVYHDPAQDVVMRDYSVQHMAPAYEKVSDQEKSNLRDALWQAAGETDTSIAGTAILAMLDIAQTEPTMDRGRLADTAFKLAADDRCGELARITAVQVCGRMGVEQALPIVEQLAQTAQSIPLRIAATAALGDIGGTEAVQILQRLAESSEPRQALAAQSALHRAQSASVKQAKR
jgi:HEAT repeat protein